jgi:signal transduction histidine kinase
MRMRLPLRLFASYALVIVAGTAVAYVTVRLLAPPLFDHRMATLDGARMGQGRGPGSAGQAGFAGSVHSAFLSALSTALLVGAAASAAVAGLAAAFVTRRLLQPLNAVRAATRLIASGRYQASVPLPREPELAALAADVNTLATALADTETRRTRLLGEVAHEMRTPLTALEGYMEGLIDGVFAPEPEILGAVSDELRRLRRLADDLSTLSRAEEQRLDLHLADTDLADLARRAAGRLAPQFSGDHVLLTVDAPGVLPVRADPDRITQVLTNIIGNALAATPAAGTVTVGVRAAGHQAEVVVTDTGTGLAADDLERVFERFYRAPGQPRRSSGSGIGLTIARNIARAHGGDVTASSAGPGRGASFVLTLPLHAGGTAPAPS